MRRILLSTLVAALAMAPAVEPLLAQGKRPDGERLKGGPQKGGPQKGDPQKGDPQKGDPQKGGRANRGQDGKARAAEVRELGGDVAGPATRAVANRDAREVKKSFKSSMKGGKYFRAYDSDDTPDVWRAFAMSDRLTERYAGRIATLAIARGVPQTSLALRSVDDRVVITNPSGVVLLDLDESRARNLGSWQVVSLDERADRQGQPAFCRSGAGHPVWGRQWCVDKGFGLGSDNDIRWGRVVRAEDVMVRRASTPADLTRDVLASVLGEVVFNRLAAHAITLGLVDPLVGKWVADPAGRQVLLVNSGTSPVAEIVDSNRDDRADLMLVTLRRW
jgi:hypothetical protein